MMRSEAPISRVPNLYSAKKIIGMVTGLVSHTRPTEIGRLARAGTAMLAEISICMGNGNNATKSPIAIALATL